MGVLALVALATGSRKQALPALCAAVLALVLLSPELASQPGFALSTLATAGLLLIAPVWRERLGRHLPGWLAEALAVPVAAQLPCTPVVVAISGQVGLYAVPANLPAVPAVASETVLVVVAALLALLSLPVAQGAAWLAYLATAWLVLVAHVGAPQPGAGLSLVRGWPGTLAALAVIGVAGVVLRSRRLRRVAAAGVVGVLLAMLSATSGRGTGSSSGRPSAVLWSSTTVRTPGRWTPACLGSGSTRYPCWCSHTCTPTTSRVCRGCCRVGRWGPSRSGRWTSPSSSGNGCSAGSVPGASRSCATIGEVRQSDGVQWEVLDATARHGTDSDPNNSSIVLRLVTHGVVVLFSGYLEGDAQRSLLERGVDLRADVLKVAHHGSRKQNPDFFDAVHAKIALTSVGAGNPYGHPAAATLQRLERDGARTDRSDRDGDVAVVVWAGRVSSVGRGGEGVPGGAARAVVAPVLLGLPGEAMTLCDSGAPYPARGGPVDLTAADGSARLARV